MTPFVWCQWDEDQIGILWNDQSLKDCPSLIQARGIDGKIINLRLQYNEARDVDLGLPLYYSNPKGQEILLAYFH